MADAAKGTSTGDAGKQEGQGDKAANQDSGVKEELAALKKSMDALQAFSSKSSDDDRKLLDLLSASEEDDEGDPKVAEGVQLTAVQVDNLSPSALVAHLEKRFGEQLDARDAAFQQDAHAISQKQVDAQVALEIKEAKDMYKDDFVKHAKETVEMAVKNPDMTVSEAYLQVTAKETRKRLSEFEKQGENKSAAAKTLMREGVGAASLAKAVEGKSVEEVAYETAKMVGLDDA